MITQTISVLLMTAQPPTAPSAPPAAYSPPGQMDMRLYCPVRPSAPAFGHHSGGLPNDDSGGPRSYQIPERLARESSWIQIFTWIQSGNVPNRAQRTYRFTSEWLAYRPIHYYLHSYGYPQGAISYNSDNFWLPLPASGQIQVSRTGPRWGGNNWSSSLRITGYLRREGVPECLPDSYFEGLPPN